MTTAGLALVAAPIVGATTANAAEPHVDNPFVGATQYVNPQWTAAVEAEAARQSDATLAGKMRAISSQPTAVWMDRISAITGNADGNGLKYHLDNALDQQQGSTPLVFNVVIYDLPGRDCHALASNGELPATDEGLERYKTEYIDPIADLLGDPQYAGLRIVATIEPDSLPNLTTNASNPACQQADPYYRAGVKYALDTLHAIPNVYNYVDLAHSGWLGWDTNAGPAAQLMAEVAQTTNAGFASIDGFITDTANTTPLVEPYLTDPNKQVGGQPVRSSDFYEWNPYFDEAGFTAHMHDLLVSAGFPSSIGMLVDTSRNGWGGPDRPTAASTSSDLNTYVNESRVDRRNHRGAWCNPSGAGIGERPQAAPSGYPHIDAFVWVKPPGESDGSSTEIPNDQGKSLDRMCDPTYSSDALGGALTGALAGAPLSGQWFPEQFQQLVANAYPVITGGGGEPAPVDTVAPSAPTGLSAGTATATSVPVSWTASTDNVGVTGYSVRVDGTAVGTASGTTYTITGLSPDTSYSVTVTARDAAGNVSAASAPLTVSTAADDGGTEPEPEPSPEPEPGTCTATYTTVNSWSGGYQGEVVVKAGTSAIPTWKVTAPAGLTTSNVWGGTLASGTFTPEAWNGSLAAGATTTVGFIGTGTPPANGTLTCS
ncbi:glycoside hydrolase family 6 [Xylanimonas cellulosilytica DSM 15894]|uniref:Glucanase n=1 Tax=Xylanimonas cellulosilytica (strain DSM 15894 / JCM 12276 / CECT 5975 / KCTC 9989 / LMG 20990 / NBRC 107835 / XIL07) TaxID=446471 RepID=D1BZM7_XYLCX|nr:glycoside hydrolase family 6 [Xylanimonas cellulosilytica DSM 15894]